MNPHGPLGGTVIFGGPEPAGPFDGMQAGFVRVPWASANPIPVPEPVIDEQAIICSDVLPTGWFGAQLAEVTPGDTVAVFGCGPVGQAAITLDEDTTSDDVAEDGDSSATTDPKR